jgi:hypothetical protein
MGSKIVKQQVNSLAIHLSVKPLQPLYHDACVYPRFFIVTVGTAKAVMVDMLEA